MENMDFLPQLPPRLVLARETYTPYRVETMIASQTEFEIH